MSFTVEQIAEEALSLPSEARNRRDGVRAGAIKTVPGREALERARKSVALRASAQPTFVSP